MRSEKTGSIAFFAFLAWILTYAGPIASIWLLMRGVASLLPNLAGGTIPGILGDVVSEYGFDAAVLPDVFDLFGLTMGLFYSAAGGFSLLATGLMLPSSGPILLIFLLVSRGGNISQLVSC